MITQTRTTLLEGLKDRSDAQVWQEFDSRYRPLLMEVGRKLGLAIADAEDAAQETLAAFLIEYRAGHYQREIGRLRDWLAGITSHKVRDAQRRLHRQRALNGSPAHAGSMEMIEDTSIHEAMEREWAHAVLRECLEQVRKEVNPQTFESFELFALQQLPASQVAEQLNVSQDAVYQNKRRVLVRIRELLPKIEESW